MKVRRKTSSAEVPAMAMGDIAFNLLIFFVILAKANDDSHLQWDPTAGKNLQSVGHSKVSIVIDKDEKLYLNGQQISEAQLEPLITEILGDAPAGERPVVLKIHKQAQYNRFQPIHEAVSQAGGEIYYIVHDETSG